MRARAAALKQLAFASVRVARRGAPKKGLSA
jgi:hypothetical protein